MKLLLTHLHPLCLTWSIAFQKGMKLPGSRPDVLRTKALSGPSPVGGAFGGTESQSIMALDDFELQAAHYNMACAHARLGNLDDVSATWPTSSVGCPLCYAVTIFPHQVSVITSFFYFILL